MFMDTLSKEQRHKNMSHIHSKDTKIEIILRKALWKAGIHYRKNYSRLPGKPDIVITKYKIAIFCDSEFFHGFQWQQKEKRITTNRQYWINKIERNIQRDRENNLKLQNMGWIVIRFWGHEIKKDTKSCVETIQNTILESIIDANISYKNER